MALFSLPITGLLLAQPFEAHYPPLEWRGLKLQDEKRCMVVVLGAGRDLGALEYPERERLSSASLQRVRYGAKVASALGVRLAVSGGAPRAGHNSEAALMRDFVVDELKQQVAVVEDRSSNTRENAAFMSEKLRPLGVTRIVLVTDVTHMARAVWAFQRTGLDIVPAPMRFDSQAPRQPTDFIPSSEGMEKSHRVLRELLGMLWYRLRA